MKFVYEKIHVEKLFFVLIQQNRFGYILEIFLTLINIFKTLMFTFSQYQSTGFFLQAFRTYQTKNQTPFSLLCNQKKLFAFSHPQNKQSTLNNIMNLKKIIERKLSKKIIYETRDFIGCLNFYISLACFDSSKQYFQLKKQFARNLYKAIFNTCSSLKNYQSIEEKNQKLSQISTLLYAIAYMIQKIEKNQLKPDSIFTNNVIEALLSVQFPDDSRIINFYQIIILFFMKLRNNAHKNRRKFLFRSILSHISHENLSDSLKFLLMNFIKRNMKIYPELCFQLADKNQFSQTLINLAQKTDDRLKIVTIIEILNHFEITHLNSKTFRVLYQKIVKQQKDVMFYEADLLKLVEIVNLKCNNDEADELIKFAFSNNFSELLTTTIVLLVINEVSFELLLHLWSQNKLKEIIFAFSGHDSQINEVRLNLVLKFFERIWKENKAIYCSMKKYLEPFIAKVFNPTNSTKYFKEIYKLMQISQEDIYYSLS